MEKCYRLPLKNTGNDIVFDAFTTKKLAYPVHTNVSSSKIWKSFEMPALAVDDRGTICIAYGALGKISSGTITHPQARYFLFYDNETGNRPSQLIKAGEPSSISTFQPPGWSSANKTIDGFYHSYHKPNDRYLDFTTATPDPQQRFVFWIAHAYAKARQL